MLSADFPAATPMPPLFWRLSAENRRVSRFAVLGRLRVGEYSAVRRGELRAFLEAELLDSVPDLVPVEPEQRGRLRLVSAGPAERLLYEVTFERFEVHSVRRQLKTRFHLAPRRQQGEISFVEPIGFNEQHRALDRV